MSRGFKIFLTISLVITLGLIGICTLAYQIVNQSLPQTEGRISIDGLDRPVQIYRDGYHIPHILADSEYSLFFAQGYITAQDRLWQMDIWRRFARGRLSNIFGAESSALDSLMLTIGIGKAADRNAASISPESKKIYQAYADGVNRLISGRSEKLPLEFILLNYRPAKWTISDCIAVYRLFAWNMNPLWQNELTAAAIIAKTGSRQAEDLFPFAPADSRITEKELGLFLDLLKKSNSILPGLVRPNIRGSGNSWVVSGSRSATGLPLLAHDPHNSLILPGIWYESHLFKEGFDVYGLSLPGTPGIMIGHNDHIAWSVTGANADNVDFFLLPNTAQMRLRYKIESERVRIPVRLDSTRTMITSSSSIGPVLSNICRGQQDREHLLTMRWTGLDVSDDLKAIIGINRASNWQDFRNASKFFHAVPLQLLYADNKGHIGAQSAGAIPQKAAKNTIIRDGSTQRMMWQGKLPFSSLSSLYDPPTGFISAADSPLPIKTSSLSPGMKSHDVSKMMAGNEFISIKDFKRLQTDMSSQFAIELKNLTVSALDSKFQIGSLYRTVFNQFSSWNGSMHKGGSEAVFFMSFQKALLRNVFLDELGEEIFHNLLRTGPVADRILLKLLKSRKNSTWFNNRLTSDIWETSSDILLQSFKDAVDELEDTIGSNVNEWSWGAVHRLTLQHPLGSNPLIGYTFNLGPFPMSGSGSTICAFSSDPVTNSNILWGPSARLITDLGRRDNSLCILPSGQSGQPLDEHYKDQFVLYREHLYHPVLTDTTRIKRSGMDLLILKPGDKDGK